MKICCQETILKTLNSFNYKDDDSFQYVWYFSQYINIHMQMLVCRLMLSIIYLQNNFIWFKLYFIHKEICMWMGLDTRQGIPKCNKIKTEVKYIFILRPFLKGYAANRNEENVYIGTKNKQKELLWIYKQSEETKMQRKRLDRKISWYFANEYLYLQCNSFSFRTRCSGNKTQ